MYFVGFFIHKKVQNVLHIRTYFSVAVHVVQSILHWGDGKLIVTSKESKPPAPAKNQETADNVDAPKNSKKRKRRQEANEDRALIKRIKSGQTVVSRNERQKDELQSLNAGMRS